MTHLAKMKKTWTGKKPPTNQELKEAHKERRAKKVIIYSLQKREWEEQKRDYDNKPL